MSYALNENANEAVQAYINVDSTLVQLGLSNGGSNQMTNS